MTENSSLLINSQNQLTQIFLYKNLQEIKHTIEILH